MRLYIIPVFSILFLSFLNGQDTTFNKRFHLGFSQLLFKSIELTDSFFVVSGLATTSYYGSIFARFDFQGTPLDYQFSGSNEEYIAAFGNDLIQEESSGNWIVSGEGADSSGGYSLVLVFNNEAELAEKIKIYNPYYPQEEFIVASFAGVIPYDGGWVLFANIVNPVTTPQSSDLYVIKFNSVFEEEWAKVLPYPELNEASNSLSQVAGNLILGAWRTNVSSVGKNYISQLYLVKLNQSGQVVKSFLYPSIPTNQLLMGPADDLLVEEDGSVIVATRVGKEEVFGNHGYIFWDPLILKVNASLGSVVWERKMRTFEKTPINQFHKIVKSPAGDGYVAAGIAVVDTGRTGAILAKVSPEGDSLWMRQFLYVTTVGCYHAIYDLEPTPDGGYVMVGEARPMNGFDTLYPPPIQQGWILKVDEWGCLVPGCQLDVGVEEAPAPLSLKIYPNPASGELYVHLPEAGQGGRFRLYDALGRQALAFAATQGEATYIVSLDGLAAGWYVLVYEEEGGEGRRWVERVVVRSE